MQSTKTLHDYNIILADRKSFIPSTQNFTIVTAHNMLNISRIRMWIFKMNTSKKPYSKKLFSDEKDAKGI